VVVVGARCAGAPLATMLARRGLRVCLVDRAKFPSETLSTHVIQPCGVAVLDRLGVLDTVMSAGAVSLTGFTLVAGGARIDTELDAAAFGTPSLCVRRITLDGLLVDAAAGVGVEVRTGTAVTGLLRQRGRVCGVETTTGKLRAPLVVGADGRGSVVASRVGAPEYHRAPPGRLFAWAYFEGVSAPESRLRLGSVGELAYVGSPTDGDLFMAAVCPPFDDRTAFLAKREASFLAGIDGWPELAGILAGANRVGPIRVMAKWHGYFRHAAGPGWVLLGDAGHFKDPSTAQGIADAFRQGERLAAAIEAGLGGADLDSELRRWWRWRDEDADEMHWFTTDLGTPGPSLLADQVFGDIADDEVATEMLLRLLNHEVLPSQLFTPPRIGRALVRIVRDRPDRLPDLAREMVTGLGNRVRRSRQRRAARELHG
jgi:2-polyprenyl-6-methoxyphenol hydroxylase-like FAD-dependent oxidoreductase